MRGMLTLRAMSLVYTTLLSFVPLLAVSFSVLKGFGVHNELEPLLLNLLAPLGDKSIEISSKVVGFVENMKIGVLGSLGLGILIYTVISLIQKIESAFNATWRIYENRSVSQRFSSYLSVVMVGPVLIFSAIGITASLGSHTVVQALNAMPVMGDVMRIATKILPLMLIVAAFSFIYILVPNTKVKPGSAFYGALVAGILWVTTGSLFNQFVGSSTSYTAIYSGFAMVLLFMIWLYLGWLILLIGASVAYFHQHPEQLLWNDKNNRPGARLSEQICLQLMVTIARIFHQQIDSESTVAQLTLRVSVPESIIENQLNSLETAGLIKRSTELPTRYMPAIAIEEISLLKILQCAGESSNDISIKKSLHHDTVVEHLIEQQAQMQKSLFEQKTLAQLIKVSESQK